jgi:glycosyltransferase involved in cell wall biosynthesis
MKRRISILWFYVDKYGCGNFRVYFPAYSLEATERFASSFIWQEEVINRERYIADLRDDIQIAVFQRPVGTLYLKALEDCRELGIKTVIELDDNLFDVPRHNPAGWVWRKKEIQKILKQALEESDQVIVSTKPLGEAIRKEMEWSTSDKIALCQNHLHEVAWGPDHLLNNPSRHENGGNVIIGWQGSTTHEVDFKECLPALKRILDENSNVRLRLFGDVPKSLRDTIDYNRFEWTGGVPYEMYPRKLVFCNFDIGLAPVTPSNFNICKSNIKWLEYAGAKIPTIASRVYPYEQAIRNGETGFLASNEEEWYQHLSLLIRAADLRKQIGEAAHAEAWEKWSASTHARSWEQVFTSLVPESVGGEQEIHSPAASV